MATHEQLTGQPNFALTPADDYEEFGRALAASSASHPAALELAALTPPSVMARLDASMQAEFAAERAIRVAQDVDSPWEQTCLYCGTSLPTPGSHGRPPKYCSQAHRSAARKAAVGLHRHAQRPGQVQPSFATVVDQALRDSRQSARALATGLAQDGFRVSPATLSEWRAGVSAPYLTKQTLYRLLALERRLAVEPGQLAAALHRTVAADRRATWHEGRRGAEVSPSEPQGLRAQLEATGAGNRYRSVMVASSEHHEIGPDRRPGPSRIRQTICAVTPEVNNYWVAFTVSTGNPVDLVPIIGCTLGRVQQLPGAGYAVRAVELLFDRTLNIGETHDIEFALVKAESSGSEDGLLWPGWIRTVDDPACRQLEIRIRFHDQQRPHQVWAGTWSQSGAGVPGHDHEASATHANGWFTLTRTNPSPGMYGFQWRWPSEAEPAVPYEDRGQASVAMPAHSRDQAEPPVFISHATSETSWSIRPSLVEALQRHGSRVQVDRHGVLPGDKIVRQIFDGAADTAATEVVVLPGHGNSGPWMTAEFDAALGRRIRDGSRTIFVRMDGSSSRADALGRRWVWLGPGGDGSTQFDRALMGSDVGQIRAGWIS